MTILVLSEVFPPKVGGSGRWLWELHRRLHGYDVHVVAGMTAGDAAFDASSELPIHRMRLKFPNWGVLDPRCGLEYLRAFVRLNRLVAEIRPDVIHCGRCLPEGLLALLLKRRRGVPFVCFAHGEELTLADTSRELRWLTRRVVSGATSIVANTQHTKQILLKTAGASEQKVDVLHPGVDTSLFKPAPPDAVLRERLGWAGRRVVLTVGTLIKRKGQDMLIRALPAIRRRCPDVLYVIVGEGWGKPYLQALAAEERVEDLVQFRGMPTDTELIECYQQCDLFALPNRRIGWDLEGFGIVLIEAQACGKPVIAGRSGGAPETLEPGRTGELIACESPDELARVVPALLEDPERRAALSLHARQLALERFDWPVLTRQAEALFGKTAPLSKNP
ncbi:MAG TPA: glycosyltransferase family 4 protein [Vicinamibacterales bacterium]|nr:glycosyltransferase family 4 protein [Vicinamibacterales bacterium]